MHLRQKFHALLYMLIGETKRILLKKKYFAEIDITDNCNLRCKHCYHFRDPFKKIKAKEASLRAWKKRFRKLHKKGIRFMLLSGGEPALRLDLIEFVYRTFPAVHIISNGTIKIPKTFGRLVIFLSVDGNEKNNDAIRGKGTFKKLLGNYSGDKRVILNMTLLKSNYKDLEAVVRISKKHKFRGVVCNLYTTSPEYPDPLIIGKEDRALIIEEIKRVKKLYPGQLLLTKSMIAWYAEPNHMKHCFWGDQVLHFDVSWKKRRCFSSPGCANCGCFAGACKNPLFLIRYLREAFKLV